MPGSSAYTLWTEHEDAVLKNGVARGLTPGQMARKLQRRSRNAVKARIRYIGIKRGDFCQCLECQRLDSLPLRLHGIPHARQLTFIKAPHLAVAIAAPEADPAPMGPDPDQMGLAL